MTADLFGPQTEIINTIFGRAETLSWHTIVKLSDYAGRVSRALPMGLHERFRREGREALFNALLAESKSVNDQLRARYAAELRASQHPEQFSQRNLERALNGSQAILWAVFGVALRDRITEYEYLELTSAWREVVGPIPD